MKLTVEFVTYADRNDWTAEIWSERELVAEITREAGGTELIEIFASRNTNSVQLNLSDFLAVIDAAMEEGKVKWSN